MQEIYEASSHRMLLFVGLLFTFIGLALTATGLMLQKLALKQLQQESDKGLDSDSCARAGCSDTYPFSKAWVFGMAVFILGNILFWSVCSLVPQVVLACWQCWAMVATIFGAPLILGEEVDMCKLLSVVVIIAGLVWVVLASPHTYEKYTYQHLYDSSNNAAFLSITGGALILLVVLVASSCCVKMGARLSAMRYILIAATINWYSVLCARCSSGFFISTVYHKDDHVVSWLFCGLFVAMLCLACANVYFLNAALRLGDAIFVVPIYESLTISGQILFGVVFFEEFSGLSTLQEINLGCGFAVVVSGVVLASTNCRLPGRLACLRQIVLSRDTYPCKSLRYCWERPSDEHDLLINNGSRSA